MSNTQYYNEDGEDYVLDYIDGNSWLNSLLKVVVYKGVYIMDITEDERGGVRTTRIRCNHEVSVDGIPRRTSFSVYTREVCRDTGRRVYGYTGPHDSNTHHVDTPTASDAVSDAMAFTTKHLHNKWKAKATV